MDRRPLLTAGLVAFVVLDLVLVVLAVRSTAGPVSSGPRPTAAAGAPSSTPSSSAGDGTSSSPAPSPSASETSAALAPATRLVVAGGGDVVWGVDTGSCEKPGTVHVSTDGGESWTSEDAPGALTRLRPADDRTAFAVGGDDQCRFRLWNTASSGADWTAPQSAAAAWGRDADDPTLFHRPGGDPVTPCRGDAEILDMTGLGGGNASVVCSDGTLRSTSDSGSTWESSVTQDGLTAVSLTGAVTGVLAVLDPDCDGVVVAALADSRLGDEQCVKAARPRSGQVSVSAGDGVVWLVAGDTVFRADADPADIADADVAKIGSWPSS